VEEVGAPMGEALGVGCGARRWGGTGQRRQGRWRERRREGEAGELAGGGAARGVAGSSSHRRGRRGAEEAGARCQAVRGRTARGWDARGRESRGQSGGTGSDGWRRVRQVAWAGGCARGVGRLGARGSVGQLDRWVQVMDVCSITLWRRYSSPRVMDPWVHHPDQPTGHRPSQGV
jgi:hypothetical protein